MSDTATASDVGDALSEAIYHAATASDSMSGQDLLLGTNFSLSRGADATGGNLTFWGRAAYSGFDGKEGDLSLDGEVVTGLLGMDYARQRWLLGLAVSRSGGSGSYSGSDSGDGKIEASLTAGVPYGAWQASERLKLWGALGYGRGEMTLKPKEQGENQGGPELDHGGRRRPCRAAGSRRGRAVPGPALRRPLDPHHLGEGGRSHWNRSGGDAAAAGAGRQLG